MQTHMLNTTTWIFIRETGKVVKVIDQYRDTTEALAGGYRVMKGALQDLQKFFLYTHNVTLDFMGTPTKGIGIMSDMVEMGVFIPYAEIDGEMPPIFVENGERKSLMDFANQQ